MGVDVEVCAPGRDLGPPRSTTRRARAAPTAPDPKAGVALAPVAAALCAAALVAGMSQYVLSRPFGALGWASAAIALVALSAALLCAGRASAGGSHTSGIIALVLGAALAGGQASAALPGPWS